MTYINSGDNDSFLFIVGDNMEAIEEYDALFMQHVSD